jgi:hypothetical protein
VIPTSRIASTATALTWPAGAVPAERTSIRSPDRAANQPAAIWDRPALWMHTNSTDGVPVGDLVVIAKPLDGT